MAGFAVTLEASNYVLNSQPAVFLDPANVEVIYECFPS